MQAAVARAVDLKHTLRALQIVSFACALLDTLRVMSRLPAMAIVMHALYRALPQLATLCTVVGVMMACMAVLLNISSPVNDRMTRADKLVGYMFGGLVAGASLVVRSASCAVWSSCDAPVYAVDIT